MVLVLVGQANAQPPVNLSTWTAESYPAVSGFGAGVWTVAGDNLSVLQSVNGQPTLFYSDFDVFGTTVQGKIKVETTGDDDFIGFALGFQSGDSTNSGADYLLIDWKQGNQSFNFGSPSCTPGSFAPRGLAVSRVTGIPTADEFWGHTDFGSSIGCPDQGGLLELVRATNLGSTGWMDNKEYTFKFVFNATSLKVFVDGVLEIDITGSFNNGRLAFYNFSQSTVRYSGFTAAIPVDIDIKPGSFPNSINTKSKGTIPVAILSTHDFDATTEVNKDSLTFGATGDEDSLAKCTKSNEDVNGDGLDDIVCHFSTQDTGFLVGDTEGILRGQTNGGTPIEGRDSVRIVQ